MRGQPRSGCCRGSSGRIIPARAGPTNDVYCGEHLNPDHPRSCGANVTIPSDRFSASGSSPLVRGQPSLSLAFRFVLRIIPARAGPTWARIHWPPREPDHPRSCGANFDFRRTEQHQFGSSPLVRGQQMVTVNQQYKPRIIPARAGPTNFNSVHYYSFPDHPRSCGANVLSLSFLSVSSGSSPLVRGQLIAFHVLVRNARIIPARAGPTHTDYYKAHSIADHPRSCGANKARPILGETVSGSSPLVRGQRPERRIPRCRQRIIPARAGPTLRVIDVCGSTPDHPRSCGANVDGYYGSQCWDGSSPLVRGQPAVSHMSRAAMRIIPARAGPTSHSLFDAG